MTNIIPQVSIESRIHSIRGKKVMLDSDLAELYGVTTGNLNKAVKRNIERFPEDFMFQLTLDEAEASRFQFGTLKRGQNIKYLPYAFTENGVAMLSSVLKSAHAIQINIQIMRAFVHLKNFVANNTDLRKAIEQIERRLNSHDRQIQIAFASLQSLLTPQTPAITKKPYSPEGEKQMGFVKRKKP